MDEGALDREEGAQGTLWSLCGSIWHLGGSVVEHLPLAQVVIQGSWDRVPALGSPQGSCFSLCLYLCLSLCVSHE